MKIKIKNLTQFELSTGDLLESNAYALVNPVNCVGVMGKGLALKFKKKYPAMYRHYRTYCETGQLEPGGYFFYDIVKPTTLTHCIINVATKNHWSEDSNLVWIQECVDKIRYLTANTVVYQYAILQMIRKDIPPLPEVAIPALGCGEGGLQYSDVLPILENTLCDVPAKFVLYLPK